MNTFFIVITFIEFVCQLKFPCMVIIYAFHRHIYQKELVMDVHERQEDYIYNVRRRAPLFSWYFPYSRDYVLLLSHEVESRSPMKRQKKNGIDTIITIRTNIKCHILYILYKICTPFRNVQKRLIRAISVSPYLSDYFPWDSSSSGIFSQDRSNSFFHLLLYYIKYFIYKKHFNFL